jgi:parallel beta-helix repeat protein
MRVLNNDILNSGTDGMYIVQTDCNITSNTATKSGSDAVFLFLSENCSIRGNTLIRNGWAGVHLHNSHNNNITDNTILGNDYGCYLHTSDNNIFWDNIIYVNTARSAYAYLCSNSVWDNGTHGNWWSDYYGPDWNQNGIGDIPYNDTELSTQVIDRFPRVLTNDTTEPTINEVNDISYEVHSTSQYLLQWFPADNHPCWYNITQNATLLDNDTWKGESIELDVSAMPIGTYNYTLTVYDQQGQFVNDTVWVTVYNNPPMITPLGPVSYPEGTFFYYITWELQDDDLDKYAYYKNDTLWYAGGCFPGWVATFDIGHCSLGLWNFTLVVNDTAGQMARDTVLLTVYDNTPPGVSSFHPSGDQLTVIIGNTEGAYISWLVSDNHHCNYSIFENDSFIVAADVLGQVYIGVGQLPIGIYNYTIVVTDDSGNRASNTVWVHIVPDIDAPVVITEEPVIIVSEEWWYCLWYVSDINPGTLELFVNSSLFGEYEWNEYVFENEMFGVTLNTTGLAAGAYNFTLVAIDAWGNSASAMAWVIYPSTEPIIAAWPDNVSYEEGELLDPLVWEVRLPFPVRPANYTIYLNGTLLENGTLQESGEIVIGVEGLVVGVYNYTLMITDAEGAMVLDTVIVEVSPDNTPPTITHPADLNYIEGEGSYSITWMVADAFPATYELWLNGTIIQHGNWTTGSWSVNVSSLASGFYNYTMVIMDKNGNWASDTVLLVVDKEAEPMTNMTSEFDSGPSTSSNAPSGLKETTTTTHTTGVSIISGFLLIIAGLWLRRRRKTKDYLE